MVVDLLLETHLSACLGVRGRVAGRSPIPADREAGRRSDLVRGFPVPECRGVAVAGTAEIEEPEGAGRERQLLVVPGLPLDVDGRERNGAAGRREAPEIGAGLDVRPEAVDAAHREEPEGGILWPPERVGFEVG